MEERFEEMNNVEVNEETNEESGKFNTGLIGVGIGLIGAGVVGGIALYKKNKGKIADRKAAKKAKAEAKKIEELEKLGYMVYRAEDVVEADEACPEETEE